MSNYPMVVGVDPGFANFGVAVIRILPEGEEIVRIDVFRTKSQTRRRHLLAVDDDSRRLAWLGDQFGGICEEYKVRAVIAEEKRRLPHSGSAAKLAMGWAVAVLIARLRGIPFRQVTPGEIKLATAGSEKASKAQVQDAIRGMYSGSQALRDFDQKTANPRTVKPQKHREHGYDAVGAVIAALDSDIISTLRSMIS
jgi:Holliday junction resolvasome RuvABC endonuclease subunit